MWSHNSLETFFNRLQHFLNRYLSWPLCAIFLLLLGMPVLVKAEPYNGRVFNYQQPDGSTFEVRLFGDEFYAVAETLNGYVVVRDSVTKFFSYATLAKDGNSFESTGVKAGSPISPALSLKKQIRLSKKAEETTSRAARTRFGVNHRGRLLPESYRSLRPEAIAPARAAQADGDILPAPPSSTTVGTRVGLVLLAQFPDRPQDVTISSEEVDAYCNDPNYTGFDNATSVRGYFSIQSNGKLQYNCLVTAYFTATHAREYYTNPGVSFGTQAKELINEGLAALKENGFDFTKCDADGNGVLDGVNIFYTGARINSWSEGLWPHKWSSHWDGLDGEGVSANFEYQICDMGASLSLGTFCHENGHMLCGFPDLYAYDGSAAEVSNYSLMSSSGSKHPVNVDPYLKIHAGWATVIDLTPASHLRGLLKVDNNTFYRYRNPALSQEYFLLEVRTDRGYEGVYGGAGTVVNPTSGLVVYHAYEQGDNTFSSIFTGDNPADYTTPYELMIVEANPSSTTTPWYNDPRPGTDDGFHSGDVSEVSGQTEPSLKFWNTASGRSENSGLRIHSISAPSDTMTFMIGTDAPVLGVSDTILAPVAEYGADALPQSFAVFNSGSGTLSYTISEDESWLRVSSGGGTATTEADNITITYDSDALPAGSYNGTITIFDESAANYPEIAVRRIAITLTVHAQPNISLDKSTFSKTVPAGVTGADTFTISNTGGGTLFYTLASSTPWLSASSTSGTVAAEEDSIDITYDAAELMDGTYHGTITLTSNSRTSPTHTLEVTLNVNGHVLITTPDGNETFWQGSRQEVIWKTDASIAGKVRIDLYKEGEWDSTLVASTENDRSYTWNVPVGQPIGLDYNVRVSSVDDANIFGESGTNFTIAALPTLVRIPYFEGFESSSSDWTQVIDDDFDWTRNSGGTPSSSTGPSNAQSGASYLYTESSSPNYPSKGARLECSFDLRASTDPQFSCFYHMSGSAMGSLLIRASTDQKHWTTLVSKSGHQVDAWVQAKADLTPFAGRVVMIQIIGTTGVSYASDMALDSIAITEASKTVTYSTLSFYEAPGNAGAIFSSCTITLAGDTFRNTAVSDGDITLSNVPAGLAAALVRDSDTQLSLSLSGNATQHSLEHSITDLQLIFADGAFAGDDASSVAGAGQLISVVFNNLDGAQFSLSDSSVREGNIGAGTMQYSVSMLPASDSTTTIDFAALDGTATAGIDYIAHSGTLTFNPGEFMKTIDIAVVGDYVDELNETVYVILSNNSTGHILDTTGAGVIRDDDGADYDEWALDYGLVGDDAAATTDIDFDGLDNLCEYALGGNPTNSDAASVLPVFELLQAGGSNWFYYVHNERTDDITLIYTVQSSTNLVSGPWQTNDVEFVGESGIQDNTKSVTNRIGVDGSGFIQLKIGRYE